MLWGFVVSGREMIMVRFLFGVFLGVRVLFMFLVNLCDRVRLRLSFVVLLVLLKCWKGWKMWLCCLGEMLFLWLMMWILVWLLRVFVDMMMCELLGVCWWVLVIMLISMCRSSMGLVCSGGRLGLRVSLMLEGLRFSLLMVVSMMLVVFIWDDDMVSILVCMWFMLSRFVMSVDSVVRFLLVVVSSFL